MKPRPTDDAGYFHARALEEQAAAQSAHCPESRHRHDEMATMYRFKEALARTKPPSFPGAAVEQIEAQPADEIAA